MEKENPGSSTEQKEMSRERLGPSRGVCCVEGCLNNDVEIHHLEKVKDNVEIVSGIIGLKGIIMRSGYDLLRERAKTTLSLQEASWSGRTRHIRSGKATEFFEKIVTGEVEVQEILVIGKTPPSSPSLSFHEI